MKNKSARAMKIAFWAIIYFSFRLKIQTFISCSQISLHSDSGMKKMCWNSSLQNIVVSYFMEQYFFSFIVEYINWASEQPNAYLFS